MGEITAGAIVEPAARALALAGVDSPRMTAELLLAHVLGGDRVRVLAHPEATVDQRAAAEFERLVERAARAEPLAYLTGTREFYGIPLRVTPDVLIPRPETEILVERALALTAGAPVRFADVGTGSGAIAIAFAGGSPGSRGWACDVSRRALDVARENARASGAAAQIEFVGADLLESFGARPVFDLVMSNPPYVAEAERGRLPRSVSGYEPHGALFAGDSGLDVFRRLIPQAAVRLRAGGFLLVEVGLGQADAVAALVRAAALTVVEIAPDLQGIPRCVAARRTV